VTALNATSSAAALDVFLVALEASGDALGTALMRGLARMREGQVSFRGLGGAGMVAAGLTEIGQSSDIALVGIGTVIKKLPTILRHLRETVDAIVAHPPDVLVLIDAPDFTHRVAARVRARLPHLPIVKYVSPTVWFWRPGRARAMRSFTDLILAVLPFEPEVHRQLGGPRCVYVGHPLLDRLDELRPSDAEARERTRDPPLVLALPGSRRHELRRLVPVFGQALDLVAEKIGPLDVVLPTLPQLIPEIETLAAGWSTRPRIVSSENDKYAAFRRARAALAASGTVTLELALAGIPSVAAYQIPAIEGFVLRRMVKIHPAVKANSVILANLVLGTNVIPEFLQDACTAGNVASALQGILGDTPERQHQIEAFGRLEAVLGAHGVSPAERAAIAVMELVDSRRGQR
jgi:lipid-A-disaccharide synthase